ncbi:diguanylate cyclase [Shewanella eurypsychrophilus]|uniref:diguanylate cyclase n=1 Tax=Shewanella eurypsychrophilus TaxID=2593656 RepID=A0ABX6V607_9GAMM|nr:MULTISPECIES: GGDEF domain-containing protein [Shewanella]QFU22782.1 diguanylate cyclase [Shewanella sp. YLB-09]QPG58071.1 diguanylate cyclase [Shewanella eurypsychrophilus]
MKNNSSKKASSNLVSELIQPDLLSFLSNNSPVLQLMIDTLPVPIFYKDIAGVYLGCNKAFEEFIKLTRKQLIGRSVYELFDKELADVYQQADQALFDSPGNQVYEKQIKSLQGDDLFVKFHKTSFMDTDGNVAGLIGVIFDITEQKRLEAVLTKHATLDDLTGLYNRREGLRQGEIHHKIASRGGSQLAVFMLDVDYFKQVNDRYGHIVGDKALQFIAKKLLSTSRMNDVLIRYGGEEFLIIVSGTSEGDAAVLAEYYRETLANSAMSLDDGKQLRLTVSIGVSYFRQQNLQTMIHQADTALYEAKGRNRNTVCSF